MSERGAAARSAWRRRAAPLLFALVSASYTRDSAPSPCADVRSTTSALPAAHIVERLACERSAMVADLGRAQSALRERARREAPALLPRIDSTPPAPRPTGYGLLPSLTRDASGGATRITESRFSLAAIAQLLRIEQERTAALAARAADATTPLDSAVQELQRLRAQLDYLESSISYHRFWQVAAADARAFFDEKNRLVARARALQAAVDTAASDAAALRHALIADVAPFVPTSGLQWVAAPDGSRVLSVILHTDIEDAAFLREFAAAIDRDWNASAAAIDRRFRIDVRFVPVSTATLYPEGAPARGASIDERAHVARFPAGALILTTGAKSIHAYKGRYVQLATDPIAPRILSHEFGHVLGFDDGYLRGTEGDASDAFGYVIVEWTGLLDDLMGAPGIGAVSAEMIDTLIRAYAPPAPTAATTTRRH